MGPSHNFGGRVKAPSGATTILRPIRKSLYDREQVWGGHMASIFFQDNRITADGRPKDITFTNMTQNGMLGTPLEFSVESIAIKPVRADPEYVKTYEQFIWSDYVLRWTCGQNTVMNEQPISVLPIRGWTPLKTGDVRLKFPKSLAGRLLTRVMDLRDIEGKPRLITSTECFGAEICRKEGLSVPGAPIDVYLCFEGVLFTML